MKRALVSCCLVAAAAFALGAGAEESQDLAMARRVEERVEATIARVRDSVVTVSARMTGEPMTEAGPPTKPVTSGGSGVVFTKDGFILTNDHVTLGEQRVRIGLRSGRTLTGDVTGRDRIGDIAVIKIAATDLPFAPLGESDRLREGDLVLALGNPFGLAGDDHEPSATLGIVSGLHRFQGGEKVYGDAIQIDAAVNPGNSGGPLFDMNGRVVGITGRISIRGTEKKNVGVGFAVPIDQIKLVLADLEVGAEVVHGYLGVRFRGETDGDGRPGVEVLGVLPGAPADRAGLKRGDRILEANGKAVDQPVRLENVLSVLPAGSEVVLAVERDGKRFEAKATLARRPGS
jgi:putative serine protease PepD